jgi:hypothetical protein
VGAQLLLDRVDLLVDLRLSLGALALAQHPVSFLLRRVGRGLGGVDFDGDLDGRPSLDGRVEPGRELVERLWLSAISIVSPCPIIDLGNRISPVM